MRLVYLVVIFCFVQLVSSEVYSIEQTIEGSGNCTTLNRDTAAILSAVLPWFGVDRFYLGYIVLGILKVFLFWTLVALAAGGLGFTIWTIVGFRKAAAKNKKATMEKRAKEDKPKKEKKEKKPKKEKKEEPEDVKEEGEEKKQEDGEKKEGEEEKPKEEEEPKEKEGDEEEVDEESEPVDDSDVDPDTDDETAEASLNRRKKQYIRINVVIWVGITIYAAVVFGWFITDFVLILTNVIQPLHCFWPTA